MKYMILISKKFPYDKGEPFLENEVKFYKNNIDKAIIFPIDIGNDSNMTRKIPPNVDVYLTCNDKGQKYKQGIAIKSILHIFQRDIEHTIRLNHYKCSIKNRFFASYINYLCEEKTKAIIKILDGYNFGKEDEITVYSYWLYTTAIIAVKISDYLKKKYSNISVISRAHRFDIYNKEQPFKIETIERMDKVFPCSDNGTLFLKKYYTDFKSKIRTAYLGTKNYGLQKTDSTQNIFLIASCSRITSIKRVDRIAGALKIINDRNIDKKIKWIHIGDGDGLEKIKKYCLRNFTNIEVVFQGYMPNVKVYDFYLHNYINLFINVSSSEGLPVSIMEAISFGIPVIATEVGGTSEIVIEKYNGYILQKDFTDDELAILIEKFIEMDDDLYRAMRIHSRMLWEKKYNAEINYPEFIRNIYG